MCDDAHAGSSRAGRGGLPLIYGEHRGAAAADMLHGSQPQAASQSVTSAVAQLGPQAE